MRAPSILRILPLLITRLLEELGTCIVERQFNGVNALFWAHKQYLRIAEDLYLHRERSISIHSALAEYWEGKWAASPKPFLDYKTNRFRSENRCIMDQSLFIAGKPNARRIGALVWHQLEAGVTGFQDAARTLQVTAFIHEIYMILISTFIIRIFRTLALL